MAQHEPPPYPFDKPVPFRILAIGQLDPAWSEYLGGMQIECRHSSRGITFCQLMGTLPDQASLLGVLNALYDLGLALVAVSSSTLTNARSTEHPDMDRTQAGTQRQVP